MAELTKEQIWKEILANPGYSRNVNRNKQGNIQEQNMRKEQIADYLHNTKKGKELVQGIKDIMSNREKYLNKN